MTLAIVGASLAGAKAAEGARAAGYEGRIVLVGEEATAPYERPPLSKAVLRGEADVESARVHPEGFYVEHDVELITARAVALDPFARRLRLDDGEELRFDAVVLTTGAQPRRLGIPGADLDGVHYLRTADDAVRLRDAIRSGGRVAVVGAGWIGSEVAASARQLGADVVLVDPGPVPLHRVLGDDIGEVFRRLHADHGVALRLGVGVQALQGSKTVEQVVLEDSRVEAADMVVVGVGVVPRVELALAAGLAVDNGIVVDEQLRTSAAGVFAAGDVANAWHPRYERRLRVEHWANALNQGELAGRNAVGGHDSYTRLPYFFSDQYDLGLEYVGHHRSDDEVIVRGDREAREFLAYWHRDGVVTAAMAVNVWDRLEEMKAAVGGRDRRPAVRMTRCGPATTGGRCTTSAPRRTCPLVKKWQRR
jgi:3-phenylpropionate/trans-cinnamate dioxygenase ferredoxin reductase component